MPTPTRRYYSSAAVAATLSASLTSSATSIAISTVTGWPASYPFTAIIGEDTNKEEIVTVTGVAGTTLTIARGVGGTTNQAHDAGETIRHGIYAQDFEDGSAHYAASTAVHGVSGSVVGTTNTQTLTNKTISGASNTLSNIPSSAISGVTGDIVSTTSTQTLTNKTISGSSNTLSNIAYSSTANTSWTAYTPDWTSTGTAPALGNGTLTGAYAKVGKIVHFRIRFQAGSTTTFGSGTFRFSLPFTGVTNFSGPGEVIGQASVYNDSSGLRYIRHAYTTTSSLCSLVDESGTGVNSGSPFPWQNEDKLSIVGTYEAA